MRQNVTLLLLATLLFVGACKDKKIDLSGDAPVKAKDFFEAFSKVSLPLIVADTNVLKLADTAAISAKVLGQFVPDSILTVVIKDAAKHKIYPVGKIEKENETYLLLDFVNGKKVTLATFVFDKKNKALSGKALYTNQRNDGYNHKLEINREPTFTASQEKYEKEKLLYTRIGWAYMGDSVFTVIVNDTNEDVEKNNTIINPIDTMPRNNHFSGNYVQDNKNFISLRDGKTANLYYFFVHFEKNNGTCIGELKGEFEIKDKHAMYKKSGDPCVIDFAFEGNEINIKEQGNCGNHRDIKCYFDDSYTKKKEKVEKKKKK